MDNTIDLAPVDEKASLKQRLDLMGVKYSPNAGVDRLKAMLEAKLAEADSINDALDAEDATVAKPMTKAELRQAQRAELLKLVRIRITNMNPEKRESKGEIITVFNGILGQVSKFVPYEPEFSENGYHVPSWIYEHLKDRKFVNKRPVKRNNVETTDYEREVPEFSIEVLPQLSKQELENLRLRQAAAAGATAQD